MGIWMKMRMMTRRARAMRTRRRIRIKLRDEGEKDDEMMTVMGVRRVEMWVVIFFVVGRARWETARH